jgi:hypothetical protein
MPSRESSRHDTHTEFNEVRERDTYSGSTGDGMRATEHEVHEIHASNGHAYHERIDRFDGYGGHSWSEVNVPDRAPERPSEGHRETAQKAGDARARTDEAGRRNAESLAERLRDNSHGDRTHTGRGNQSENAGGRADSDRHMREHEHNMRDRMPEQKSEPKGNSGGGHSNSSGGKDCLVI